MPMTFQGTYSPAGSSPRLGQEQNSTIFRASYSNGTVAVQAVGSVPGSVLNQFSMDEYEGYFQVATSRIATINGNATESDDVYVLNQNMSQVSALQNIAPGENLYAVRFVGDMGYVVTFEQIDPLFAISFADIDPPGHPQRPQGQRLLRLPPAALQQLPPGGREGHGRLLDRRLRLLPRAEALALPRGGQRVLVGRPGLSDRGPRDGLASPDKPPGADL